MQCLLIDLKKARDSGRLDFDFFNPSQEAQINLAQGYTKSILGQLCSKLTTGKTAPRNSYPPEGVRILKVKNVRGSGLNWNDKFFVSEEFFKSAQRKAEILEGDILMLCAAHNKSYIGRVDIVTRFPQDVVDDDGRCICVGELIIIRANPTAVLPEYLIAYLRLPVVQEKIRKMVKGQTAHLYPKDLAMLEVVLPPREIQEELAEMNLDAERQYAARLHRAQDDLNSTRQMIKSIILTGTDSSITSNITEIAENKEGEGAIEDDEPVAENELV